MYHPHRQFGLIGFPLSHSFSPGYFANKFKQLGLKNCSYGLFPLQTIEELPTLLSNRPFLEGLNVTIPYKSAVIPFLDELDPQANMVGAVNCIQIEKGKRKGFNTDVYGFELSLRQFLPDPMPIGLSALVLGTGGAAKSAWYVLQKLGIPYNMVSRQRGPGILAYPDITADLFSRSRLIVNTTPLGMSPRLDECPPLPYHAISSEHFFFDLIYNPETTMFLKKAIHAGANTQNGLSMLHLQAERAWEIWNSAP